jgi:hypothetical protein
MAFVDERIRARAVGLDALELERVAHSDVDQEPLRRRERRRVRFYVGDETACAALAL